MNWNLIFTNIHLYILYILYLSASLLFIPDSKISLLNRALLFLEEESHKSRAERTRDILFICICFSRYNMSVCSLKRHPSGSQKVWEGPSPDPRRLRNRHSIFLNDRGSAASLFGGQLSRVFVLVLPPRRHVAATTPQLRIPTWME